MQEQLIEMRNKKKRFIFEVKKLTLCKRRRSQDENHRNKEIEEDKDAQETLKA